ncbi:hypothetical protein QSJ18_19030 [Gordonia sp. ABSL1-1]|uniref:hypothetical protein n=1 Tax=Gordonia sp. ABSL1-1 TaxID=3053923 RepID=UPI0025732840|nr:hypothetical protein [Gordonia sp. ABSL1-1]MDL9938845.1 hypothetical protein [Gordonia sp. ABSL1-1]
MNKSFDPEMWPVPMRTVDADIHVGELSMRAESCRRKVAFYLDEHGEPVAQTAAADATRYPVLVTRLAGTHFAAGHAILHIDATLPLRTAITDLAFPGNEQTDGRMIDITVVDQARHRRTLRAELPRHVTVTGTVMVALRTVDATTKVA